MYCDFCGEPIVQGAAKCPKCQKPVRPLVQSVGIDVTPPVQPQKTGAEWKRLEKAITNQYWRFNVILVMLAVIILLCFSQNIYFWFVQRGAKPVSETVETHSEIVDTPMESEADAGNTEGVVEDGQSLILHRPEDIAFSDVLFSLEVREPAVNFTWQKYCEETQSWDPVDAQIFEVRTNDTYTRTDLCVKQMSEAIYGKYRCWFTMEDGEFPEPVEANIIRPAD